MTRSLRLCLAAGLLISSAHPQEPNTGSSVIQSESRLVLVDTVVTDRKGNFVRDLTQKDFRVFEDNKEQTISSFSIESAAAAPEEARKHYTLLLFDNSTAGSVQAYARQAALKFVEANAGPDKLIAVAEYFGTLRVTQNFTSDLDKLRQAISSPSFGGGPALPPPAPPRGRGPSPTQDNYSIRNLLTALQNVAQGLAGTPGRKTLIFISGGFLSTPDTLSEVARTIEACNRANVGVYTIARALAEAAPGNDPFSSDTGAPARNAGRRALRDGQALDTSPESAQQALTVLASGTGGFAISNTNDLFGGFEKIGQEQESYYILGYTPAKEARTGACHTLKVRIDKSGDTVRSRAGYCEAKALDVLSGTAAEHDLEARMTSGASSTVTGATMLAPFFYTAANTAKVHVALEVPAGTMQFTKDKGKFRAVMNVVGIAWLADGSVKARFSDSVKLAFDDKKEADAFNARPFLYEKQFPIGPGKFNFRLVFSSAAKQFGRVETPLTIDPWEPKAFAIGGIALSRRVRPAEEVTQGIGAELTDDAAPLVVNGVEVMPAGSNVFSKSAKAYIYTEIYEPALAQPGVKEQDVPAVGVRMELLEPGTGKVKKDFGLTRLRVPPPAGSAAIPVGLILSAPELDSGPYTLRISAADAAGRQSMRTAEVRLEK